MTKNPTVNSLVWWSSMWRPGKRRSLFAQKNRMLGRAARDRQTQFTKGEKCRRW